MKQHNAHILEGSLTRGVITLSTPVIFAMFFQSLLNIVDTFWVGKLGATAVAALSMSWPVVFITIALAAGISTGATALVARFVGGKDISKAGQATQSAMVLSLGASLLLTGVGFVFAPQLFTFLGASGEMYQQALAYTNIIFYGTVFMILLFTLGAVLRGEGDTTTPMKIGIAMNIVNIVIDPFFIFTLGWGVAGAAIGTVIANIFGFGMYLAYFWRGRSIVPLIVRHFVTTSEMVKEILFIGVPASLRNVSNAIGVFFTIKIISSYGTAAVAAYGIAFRVESFGVLPVVAIALSAVTMVGQNLGAAQLRRAKASGWVSVMLGTTIMAVFGFLLFINASSVVAIFNNESEVVRIGTEVLKIKAPFFLFSAVIMILSSAFQAFGKSHYSLVITVLRVILMIGLAYLFNSIWGLSGVWWAITVSGLIFAVASMFWYHRYQPQSIQPRTGSDT